ncbi:MAG: hypothetical protein A2898_03485 [Candidatus Kerfeldbacteria bacterium RIFCSPLOWO2_01_FULL_48_11]|uniref:Uncharacterized protein n=1 Tax=Candidatus Kerfeldbacteria bacterium RIFCSPLOWO2_01_FULL_48_11 TaxID=1798543 RepID=A0A1G2B2D6_9BACT|nr:MAG: hypothetical protein UY34_C0010G0002 [Parcubacteria group bacterium GW2011_GWA2_48_9]KKW16254.1 MAG: hypothetical protein UY52_C0007G0014 [Parcubacteria group bacterium GW2011_GWC2_49_9]OGY83324.1 MAG: hypothetical protein A2898_03485 [Candidatus Kerfeldbacteria bacterium RIFCSPLOWO2_01_FULL_48_11]HCJ52131.1 hypothetical protein [Candidatus Kerfeldbacteria bacterium]
MSIRKAKRPSDIWAQKRRIIGRLLAQGKLSKRQIAGRALCNLALVYEVAHTVEQTVNPDLLVAGGVESLVHEERQYVTTRLLADGVGFGIGTISENLKDRKIPHIVRYRHTVFRTPINFFPLDEVWSILPDWKKRYDHNAGLDVEPDPDERNHFRDLTDGEFDLLCALMQWWINKQFWPSAEDLVTVRKVKTHYTRASEIRHRLRKL